MTPETPESSSPECADLVRFHALPKSAQEKILDECRNWSTEGFDWWDFTYDDFIRQMEEIGVKVATRPEGARRSNVKRPAIYYSGFSSQGDGACFEGQVDNWTTFFSALYPEDFSRYQPLWAESEAGSPSLSWTYSGRYYHYNSCTFHSDFDINNEFDEDERPLRHAVKEVLVKELTALSQAMFVDAEAFIKKQMRELYSALEDVYDHLTSDEAVLDSLIANDQLGELLNEYERESTED
jgi:hypothetical protein